jgi:hypothetical protein
LIIIKYPINDEDLDLQMISKLAEECRDNHPDHEFIFLPKELEYEVIKNDTSESITTFEGCSETVSRPTDSGLLSSREPELRIGDTLLGRGYETDSGSLF